MVQDKKWHVRCPHCRAMTPAPTAIEKPEEVRCAWCGGEFTAAQFVVAQNGGGWWTAEDAAERAQETQL